MKIDISQFSLFLQFKHDIAFLMKNQERLSVYEAFLRQWRVLMSRSAKKNELNNDKKTDPEPNPSKESSSSENAQKNDKKDSPPDWNFGMFSPNPAAGNKGKEQGQGRPIGGNPEGPDSKMLLYGALGIFAVLGSIAFFEMGYKEISWKDFINK
jgi:hypothetical protein